VAEAIHIPLIVSGGVGTLEDIKAVKELVPLGVAGVITGRALYEGTMDLAEAIRVAKRD
jgi:phosphoribosylformimino-5-aminoimidazole carboxamide ribotide isomerase